MEKRIQNLEALSMEQENTIEILNREVQTQLASINKEEQVTADIEDETPPPHY